jgi:hypothetical protein
MKRPLNVKLVAAVVAAIAVVSGGAAIAATQLTPKQRSQAVINDAAQQLGVQPNQLSDALKKALEKQVDAAVAAGQMTKAEGDAIKQRIESGDVPLVGGFGFGPGFGFHRFGGDVFRAGLDAAASYLGLTTTQLQNQLQNGKTLAQIAKDKNKSVDGLIQTLTDSAKKQLDAAVSAGRITSSQESTILSNIKQRITDAVNGKLPARPDFDGDGPHWRNGGSAFQGGAPGLFPRGAPPTFGGQSSNASQAGAPTL